MRQFGNLVGIVAVLLCMGTSAWAHCQIPCGIYGDETRFTMMLEHVTTIEKSMKQIESLGSAKDPKANQIVRWVNNKEAHADELSDIVTFYFMAQRVKPAHAGDSAAHARYFDQLSTLHAILIHSMKAKQTTDLEQCATLRQLIEQFKSSYLAK